MNLYVVHLEEMYGGSLKIIDGGKSITQWNLESDYHMKLLTNI